MDTPNTPKLTVSLFNIPASMITKGMVLSERDGARVTSILGDRDKLSFLINNEPETFEKDQPVKLDIPVVISVGDKLSDKFTVSAADIYMLKVLEDTNAAGGIVVDFCGSQDFANEPWVDLSITVMEIFNYFKSIGNPYACMIITETEETIPF